MSRSYRKPYDRSSRSSSQNKKLTNQAVRQAYKRITQRMIQYPDVEMPRIFPFWFRDRKSLQLPTASQWSEHVKAVLGITLYRWQLWPKYRDKYLAWPPEEFVKLTRK